MPKRSKKPADLNRLAAAIVGDATDDTDALPETAPKQLDRQRAGRAGGKARAAALDADKRSAIAKKAAQARWAPRQAE